MMGGNGSYNKEYGGVRLRDRTHIEIRGHTILGHKILLSKTSAERAKIPMNCNSPNQVYVIGTCADRRSGEHEGEITVHSVAFYEGHRIKYTVDVKYAADGTVASFREGTHEATTHAHNWAEISPGIYGRVSRARGNHLCPDARWTPELVEAIETFNAKRIKK